MLSGLAAAAATKTLRERQVTCLGNGKDCVSQAWTVETSSQLPSVRELLRRPSLRRERTPQAEEAAAGAHLFPGGVSLQEEFTEPAKLFPCISSFNPQTTL